MAILPMIEKLSKSSLLLNIVTDLNLQIISANQQVQEVAAVVEHQINGALLYEVLPFFNAQDVLKIKTDCLCRPGHSDKLETCSTLNGQARHFTWMVCTLTNYQGDPVSLQWVGVDTTERNRRNESSFFQQKVLENISDALITLNAEMIVTAFNRKAEELYDLNADQVVGRKFSHFFSFQPAHESKTSALKKLAQTGQWCGVLQFEKVSGALLYTFRNLMAVKNDCGSLLGYIAVDRDVTEHYRLQQNHQKQTTIKTLLQEIMDQAKALAWATDAAGWKRYMNATYRQSFGLEAQQDKVNIIELFSGPELSRIQESNHQVINQGTVLEIIEELSFPQEQKRKFRSLKFPVHTEEGTFAAGFALDITRELQREEELAYLKQRFEIAANIIADIIIDWDVENDRMWRSDPEGSIDVHPNKASTMTDRYERLHPADEDRFKQTLQAALNSGAERWQCEYRYQSRQVEGRYKTLFEKGVIFRNETGKAVRMISVVQDITEKRRLQKELKEKERAVVAASFEGQEAERSELARELHDNVGQVLAMCKLFVDIAADSVQHEYLEKCRHQLQRAMGEIRNLSHRLSPETLTRKGLLGAVSEMIEGINQTGKLHITLHQSNGFEEADLPRNLKTTAYRIVQECISNILKHAQATIANLKLCLHSEHLVIEVKDNGQGFDPEKVRSGIGLKNIFNRIELSRGKIELNAAPGKGCNILVQLPIAT